MTSTAAAQSLSFARRSVIFYSIGALGLGVQLATVGALTGWADFDYLLSTAIGVEAAVVHNFIWHERWTWADRSVPFAGSVLSRLVRFNVANGLLSIGGNVAFTALFVAAFGTGYLIANVLAVTACSLLNFLAADKLVFTADTRSQAAPELVSVALSHSPLRTDARTTRRDIHAAPRRERTLTMASATMNAEPRTVSARYVNSGDHTRHNRSFLAQLEKRALVWIAHRLPARVNSDHLSVLGLVAMIGGGVAFAAGAIYVWALPLVVVALAVNWFGDSLDGTLARVRNQQRPRYGYYVDHTIDVFGTTCLFGGLALGGWMSPVIAMGLLAAYFGVMAEVFLATHVRGVFRMSFLGFGPTELRLVLAAGALALMRDPTVVIGGLGSFQLFDVGGVVAIAGLVLTFLVSGTANARALYAAEPIRR